MKLTMMMRGGGIEEGAFSVIEVLNRGRLERIESPGDVAALGNGATIVRPFKTERERGTIQPRDTEAAKRNGCAPLDVFRIRWLPMDS